MKDYFRPSSGLSLERARWGLGNGLREARGPRLATSSARADRTLSAGSGAHAGHPCRWESRALPRAQAMVAKQRIRMANEKHSKNITQRGNVAKTLVRRRRCRASRAGRAGSRAQWGGAGPGWRAVGSGPVLPAPQRPARPS